MMPDSTTNDVPLVLTITEVAALLRVSPRTVRRAVDAGSLRAIRLLPGGAPRFARADIEALIAGGQMRPHRSHLAAVYHLDREVRP
jgi:excisionase family DNA binding protein